MNEQFYRVLHKTGISNLIYTFSRNYVIEKKHDHKKISKDISALRSDIKSSCIVKRPEEWDKWYYDLDVIIPVYNTGIYFKKCIESVLNQKTKYDFKILVVNDGSTDSETLDMLSKYENNKNIIIYHTQNSGLPAARNYALERSKGHYITFLDSDDILYDNAIEYMLNAAIHEDADIVEGGYINISEKDEHIKTFKHDSGIISNLYGYAWGKIYSRKIFNSLVFPLYYFEDSITKSIVLPTASKIIGISDMVYGYRRNKKSISFVMQGNNKSIDSYWIIHQINKDRIILGLEDDQYYYEHMLNCIKLTYRRNIHLSYDYQKNIFERFCVEMRPFEAFHTNNVALRDLELSIRSNNYTLYTLWNKMHMFD